MFIIFINTVIYMALLFLITIHFIKDLVKLLTKALNLIVYNQIQLIFYSFLNIDNNFGLINCLTMRISFIYFVCLINLFEKK